MSPAKRANKFCSTTGTGEKGRGIEIKVPAAVRAAKRATRVVPVMAFLFAERETLFPIKILLIIISRLTDKGRGYQEGGGCVDRALYIFFPFLYT
jgi:hypothetical protein